ncbi:UDP-N-acetylmuramoyl-tripeptide--D-alanyl-D-alanine ligase [Pleionea litopenaei]|uniref:UDP-N-acetylmuramoyl-tripeptide--D-alanyl-D-alanine ligase n=1 Tax=Pleionea litopenaei TaxID=3070815 RepID=A0AA51RWE2_9GAMM|nr:UDP-N-acetylmuramoyl-tripeptide--D-alanyl-D-alanine ligase [Pleionea sp. HL-JVS1]WMS88678.1 UDP-N-acetylmuramoyl-tripeptide--D-alanyl-D-alanine ligase [Pleionea sp. HL-JVS1]
MIAIDLLNISEVTNGKLLGENLVINNIFTDTRAKDNSGLFIAIRGASFDAHNFISDAEACGASALLVEKECSSLLPQVVVKDTRQAMADIAKLVRKLSVAKFIGLTGSVGKTTVKEMIAHVLSQCGNTLATAGNFNNDIGVPLTLFRLTNEDKFAVIEMGANKPGDIRYTSNIVSPNVALITNVAAAHLEGFGDLQGVATAKGEIYQSLSKQDTAIVNIDDSFAQYWLNNITCNIVKFGLQPTADVTAINIHRNSNGGYSFELCIYDHSIEVNLKVPGKHNILNALACASACNAIGIETKKIASGLESFDGVSGRLQIHQIDNLLTIIDDTYNANYTSLAAGIDVLAEQNGQKILALGDMGELGQHSREYHYKAGQYAEQAGVDLLVTIGINSRIAQSAFANGGEHFETHQAMIEYLKQKSKNIKTTILMKGSRSAHMEKVVNAFLESPSSLSEGEG